MPISGIVGGIGGMFAADMNRDAATQAGNAQKAAIAQMIAKLDSVGMPPDQSAAIILEQYKQAGIYTPGLEQQVRDSVSEFSKIKGDASIRDNQVKALQQMSQYGKAGLTADERAASRLAQSDVQRQNEANQQSIIQNMQQRGQAGGGAEIAARLGGAQGSANQASEQADRISAMAAQRALQAISQGSNMAGQLRQQDFGEDSAKAAASDEMNRFNVQNQMAIGQRNVASSNQGQAANLANLQQVNNSNVGQNNQEKYNQLQRQRQYWTDKLDYAKAYANPLQQYGKAAANQAMGEGQARSQGISSGFGALSSMMGGGVWDSVMGGGGDEEESGSGGAQTTGSGGKSSSGKSSGGGGGGSAASLGMLAMMSDKNLKTNIEELFSLPMYAYEYKDKSHGKGKHVSIMAQDLENTDLGKSAVIETADGKAIDYAKLCGLMFAQITQLTKEVSELKNRPFKD